MSQVAPTRVVCPSCGTERIVPLLESLNGDVLPHQVEAIADGTFERLECACGQRFQPEHPMLLAQFLTKTWIVMQPVADRPRYATIEREVERIVESQFARAPAVVRERLHGVRARLVFGQHMLAEAVRVKRADLDPVLLECAKLLAWRDDLARLLPHGPCELCFEGFTSERALRCAIHGLPGGERQGELLLAERLLSDARDQQAELEAQVPDLFTRAYVSATRYLFGDHL